VALVAGAGLHVTADSAVAMPLDDVRVVQVEGVDPVFGLLLWRPPTTRSRHCAGSRPKLAAQVAGSAEEDAAVDQG